tara:strand:+ start:297 stop:410 length:114 start_codon:yes stop_codon:yes gene_type:complete
MRNPKFKILAYENSFSLSKNDKNEIKKHVFVMKDLKP